MTDQGSVLVLISLDPRQSHRANEAMRIGLGIVSGENEVTFVLTGPGVHLLDGDTDDLVDGDDIAKFRSNLKALGIPFHVEEASRPSESDRIRISSSSGSDRFCASSMKTTAKACSGDSVARNS